MMAISVVSSVSAPATTSPALPGIPTTDKQTGGFADLLFSQLGKAIGAASSQAANASGHDKSDSEKSPPIDGTAQPADPALAFLMAAANLQAPSPTNASVSFTPDEPTSGRETSTASAASATAAETAAGPLIASGTEKKSADSGYAAASKKSLFVPPTGQTIEADKLAAPASMSTPPTPAPVSSTTGATPPAEGMASVLASLGINPGTKASRSTSATEMPKDPTGGSNAPTKPLVSDETGSSLAESPDNPATQSTLAAGYNIPAMVKEADDMKIPANIAVDSKSMPPGQESTPPSANTIINQHIKTEAATVQVRPEISTPLQSSAWGNEFANKVVWLVKNDQQQVQINITPPQLGPIQISLHVNGDQASAAFGSANVEVRQAIESSLPQLKEMFASAGINLGQADVGANLAQQNREAPQQSTNGTRLAHENAILPGDGNTVNSKTSTPIQRGRGLVDLFA